VPFSPGVRLGAYEVVRLIGAGGMGEVYEARDTRLDRIVALKVLPESLSADPDRRERFEREARAVAALNHPHICGLHDVGEAASPMSSSIDTTRFLVMEYVEGHTLGERLARGPLSLAEALRHAIEIADALDHAHSRGLIHRDLKPGNIMLTGTGAKLLDFGLAKAEHALDVPSLATVSLEEVPLTAPGVLLGTFPYMAPEVLEGRGADARSDVFSFGAVVHEMVSGQRAFQARTVAGLIGAILHTEPAPLSSLREITPPTLDHLVARCLAKSPASRWQTARDVMLELKWIERDGRNDALVRRPSPKLRLVLQAALIVAAGALVVSIVSSYVRVPFALDSSIRFAFSLPTGLRPADVALTGPVTISPDGQRVVFAATGADGTQRLWVRPLDSLSAESLTGTDGGAYPFWSPDGGSIAFFAQRKLKRVYLTGGPPQTLCDAVLPRGGSWSRNGVIIFSGGAGRALYHVSSQGGAATAVPADGSNSERYWPSFLPDGRRYLYFARPQKFGIYVASLDSAGATLLLSDYVSATYSSAGYLLGVLGTARGAPAATLMARRFDLKSLEASGDAIPVAENIQYHSGIARAAFSVSENGTLIYDDTERARTHLIWFDRQGRKLGSVGGALSYGQPSLSADARTVVAQRVDPVTQDEDLWLIDTSRDVASRLTANPNIDFMPVVSPNGTGVVFASARGAPPNLFHKLLTGSVFQDSLLSQSADNLQPTDWSPDGRSVVFARLNPRTQWDLWRLPISSDGQRHDPVPLLETEFNEHLGRFSPNGRWLAYVSDESGTNEVYVRAYPTSAMVKRISTNGGSEPRWRGDGKELFFLTADGTVMAVNVSSESTFDVDPPAALFTFRMGSTRNSGYDVRYTVAPDGQRFLVSVVMEGMDALPTKVVMNWPAALTGR
jgi:eukaryotic-like serine/threonine-protein kinase